MTTRQVFQFIIGAVACVCVPQVAAVSITYHVNLDTSVLVGISSLELDFQLVDGDGVNNSSALINQFDFGDGSPDGTATPTGGASGDLSSAILLSDVDVLNWVFQGFTPGNVLSFDVTLTSTATGVTPDSFAFGIYDVSANVFDLFVQVDLLASGQTLRVDSPLSGVSATVSVPDSGSVMMFPLALASLGLLRFSFRKKLA